jgi:hypothetical protein
MNERIRELAEQAGYNIKELDTQEQLVAEKFAELIVKDVFAMLKEAMIEGDDSKTDEIIDDRLQDAAGDVVDAYGIVDRVY